MPLILIINYRLKTFFPVPVIIKTATVTSSVKITETYKISGSLLIPSNKNLHKLK